MNGLAHHIVDAGREEIERLFERVQFVHSDHWSARALADHARISLARFAVADEKGFDCAEVGLGDRADPFPEFVRTEAR